MTENKGLVGGMKRAYGPEIAEMVQGLAYMWQEKTGMDQNTKFSEYSKKLIRNMALNSRAYCVESGDIMVELTPFDQHPEGPSETICIPEAIEFEVDSVTLYFDFAEMMRRGVKDLREVSRVDLTEAKENLRKLAKQLLELAETI